MDVKFCRSSVTKIIVCSDKTLKIISIIKSGFKNLKNLGPKYSIGKNGISYLHGKL